MYYFANDEYVDYIYGSGELVCIDFAEVKRLASDDERCIYPDSDVVFDDAQEIE